MLRPKLVMEAGMEAATAIKIYMMSEEEIIERLKGIGYKDFEIPAVMQDVATVIYGRVLASYLPTLPEPQRIEIASLRAEEAQDYFKDNAASFSQFPQDRFDAIHDKTWEDYFKSVA